MTNINELANGLYENARVKGFYDFEDRLRHPLTEDKVHPEHLKTMLTEHFGNRLMLIAGEAVEAHEELRSGRKVGELYFSGDPASTTGLSQWPVSGDDQETLLKPEGVLMELVDVGVRTLETIAGILAQMTPEEKATLRSQVPQSEATELIYGPHGDGPVDIANVNVAELFALKANYNAQRAAMHGRKF